MGITRSNSNNTTVDELGQCVQFGDKIKLLKLDPALLSSLEGYELELVKSMLGDIFTVTEISDAGYVIVNKELKLKDGVIISQSVSLAPNEMKLEEGLRRTKSSKQA